MEGTIGAEEEEEQKDPRRGLLSGARAETAGQAHWDLYLVFEVAEGRRRAKLKGEHAGRTTTTRIPITS